jgi:hypothetical protein
VTGDCSLSSSGISFVIRTQAWLGTVCDMMGSSIAQLAFEETPFAQT